MDDDKQKFVLVVRSDYQRLMTSREHAELLADLKPLAGKYAFHVLVETKI
ncbi:hypothetical protein [Leuconostoc pseudomesenteroides]|uniref:Uncharacterized protein n=1 Tax=Leuconostoc pseudomesenteroides TaxID=33968 RepID=A0ABT6HE24_LEUPS|nr:hypothetical protein [Leuconostoc pseudomesenteroides]MDG9734318.1 hypothetical protein [Leuconostoc pseudomesenteroides]NKZ36854.1 hypothetical protein [Leuconostoc pseudomesenteroides]QQB27734.1 hypothetical protein I6H60_01660 [Leuconostoc pseudomesenteroides]